MRYQIIDLNGININLLAVNTIDSYDLRRKFIYVTTPVLNFADDKGEVVNAVKNIATLYVTNSQTEAVATKQTALVKTTCNPTKKHQQHITLTFPTPK